MLVSYHHKRIPPMMISLGNFIGGDSWNCEGESYIGSSCIHKAVADTLNLFFLIIFFLFFVIDSIAKNNSSRHNRRGRITVAVSVCCAVISCLYLVASLWGLLGKNGGLISYLDWLPYVSRTLVWIALTVSLLVKRSKLTKHFTYVWWILFFFLSSAINVEVLVRNHTILILDLVSWSVAFLLLLRALTDLSHFLSQRASDDERLQEPLLINESQNNKISHIGQASFLSKLLFSWVSPLLSLGNSRLLALEDIPRVVPDDEATTAHTKFAKIWDAYQKGKGSSGSKNMVIHAILKVFLKDMILVGICILLRTICVVVAPLLLYGFVNYSNRETENLREGLLLVGILVVVKILESFSHRHFFFNARRTGMRMRSTLMVAIYKKQLKLSSLGRRRHSAGEITNYIAVDAYRMGEFPMWFHVGWSSTLQLFLAVGVLFGIMGIGVLPGLVPLIICAFLNVPTAKLLKNCQSQLMIAQDKRLRSTSEILNSMKIIKLQSLEEKFKNLIESYREDEFYWLARTQYLKIFGTVLYWMCPTIVSSVIFFGCALLKSVPLNAGTIFTILAALRTMSEPVKMIPEALSIMIQVKVSFDRINSFLIDDEFKNEGKRDSSSQESDTCIQITKASFSWDQESATSTIKDVNMKVSHGQKIAVCGPVGCGKSSLLYAILGEITRISGTVDVVGSIAYVSQASWIQSGTIRDNILFGKAMEKTKYDKAIKVCALDTDLENFGHRDLTEIGQRGLNMSGGQKQRIQLARAVYNDADIYLLDDPFSALDAHTAATLFNDCVMDALGKKTVILVTHQVEFLSAVDNTMVMESGRVTQSGSYGELLKAGTAFEQLLNAHKSSMTLLEPSVNGNKSALKEMNGDNKMSRQSKDNSEAEISVQDLLPGIQLTEEEEKEIGNVGWRLFMDYAIISKSTIFLILSLLSQSGFVAFQAAASYWLAFGTQMPKITTLMLVGVYTLISTVSAVFVYLRSLFAALSGLKASKAFFSNFNNSIFSAPMLFFDSTPIGRILTRASSDLSVVDFDIPFSFAFVQSAGFELLATIGIMTSVTWQVLFVAIFATVASKYIQGYYQSSARELMRINGTTKAPVMNFASETSLGVATIRAFNMEERFFKFYLTLVDTDASSFFYSNATMEWLVIRTEALQNLTLFTAAFLLVLLPQGFVPPGLVGLSLSYALALTGTQVFLTRWFGSLSNFIISVERIKQFMHIPPEPPAIIQDNRPPSSWPSKGRIEFLHVKIRYRPNSPLVLRGISCTFTEGTRIGIVGRTGSGKTTLITALFRLVEPDSGKIIIDGLDICSMGLKDLRMKLSVIPQEPTLFKGSIRTNLDPLGLYSDDDIWEALEKCQLKAIISSLPNLLDSSVSDEGENWSAGQRQLFCLGRVLLKRNRILVLDEATASIDSATDAILQKIIREEFSDSTVLTVAHRVPTVIDSDTVMLLSYGKLVEFDQPSKLMETNSFFSKLVAEYWSSCRKNSVQRFDNYQN